MTPERAFAVLQLDRKTNADAVRAAHRRLAMSCHPDTGGSDAAMAELNAARDLVLELLSTPTPKMRASAKCSCRGFRVNPFCEVHGRKVGLDGVAPDQVIIDEAQCATCLGEKRVKSGPSWATVWVACPDCAVET